MSVEADGRPFVTRPQSTSLAWTVFLHVDGVQSATVNVRVFGYAREDRFRVDPG